VLQAREHIAKFLEHAQAQASMAGEEGGDQEMIKALFAKLTETTQKSGKGRKPAAPPAIGSVSRAGAATLSAAEEDAMLLKDLEAEAEDAPTTLIPQLVQPACKLFVQVHFRLDTHAAAQAVLVTVESLLRCGCCIRLYATLWEHVSVLTIFDNWQLESCRIADQPT
jgi:hypothetical protein